MKIGYDAKRFFQNRTGLGNYSRDLVRIMQQFYPDNSYLLYTPSFEDSPYKSIADLDTVRLPKGFINNRFKGLWRTKNIVPDLVSDKIEIFHGLSGELPMSLEENDIKSVVTIHDLIFLRYPELYKPFDRYIYKKKFSYACRHADCVVAISQQTKSDIIEFLEIEGSRIKVIYQGCHPAFKSAKSEKEKSLICNQLNIPKNFILNVGTIEPRKNALTIVKAMKDVDFPLVFVGKGTKYKEQLVSFIQQHGMSNRVFFLEGLSMQELSTLYSNATAFVYPSVFEGFGIPIIEALYSGTPVITTAGGVFPEAGGSSSIYVDPADLGQLKEAIFSIINSPSKQEEMIIDGLKYAQRFNDNTIAGQWQNTYSNL